jgi:hypothetical protein
MINHEKYIKQIEAICNDFHCSYLKVEQEVFKENNFENFKGTFKEREKEEQRLYNISQRRFSKKMKQRRKKLDMLEFELMKMLAKEHGTGVGYVDCVIFNRAKERNQFELKKLEEHYIHFAKIHKDSVKD